MIILTEIKTTDPRYGFVEDLLNSSFPVEERRDDDRQRYHTDYNELFHCFLALDDQKPVGFITIWKLSKFYYAEHLATSPGSRNKGYGKQILESLKNMLKGIIILEVERPEDEMSIRRINFYRRCGFYLCTRNYIQPPYRNGGIEVPLYLMYTGTRDIEQEYIQIKDEIYEQVYEVKVHR